jgi:hypothetical protein
MNLDGEIINYNKVKEIVLNKLITEGLLDQSDADEFSERCHVLVYRGTWFSKWFDRNMKRENSEKEGYYIRIIELKEREDDVDKLLRRTTGNYDE